VHFVRSGEGVLVQNEHVVHGRTPFVENEKSQRVLARKWFVRSPQDAKYKHVPGMNVAQPYAALYPDQFAPTLQEGDWHFDGSTGENVEVTS
jgi:hypothetical protein